MSIEIDWSVIADVREIHCGDGQLEPVWSEFEQYRSERMKDSDEVYTAREGGLAGWLILECPFAYGAYYGDCGEDYLSDPLPLSAVLGAIAGAQ